MGITPWQCAVGDAPSKTLNVASTVALAPPDDSVDTNKVVIQGTGTISSFGPPPGPQLIDPSTDPPEIVAIGVTKQVTFVPTGGSITLTNSANLTLLGGVSRTIANKSYGNYSCDPTGHWVEMSFQDSTTTGGGGGPAGPPGATGVQGPPGATGLQGVAGPQGATGLQGPPGATGLQGVAGAQGATGLQGASGPQGATGIGTAGAQGATGLQGASGPQGASGLQGASGVQGASGLQGVAGPQGATGLTGGQGATGLQGSTGPQGATGPGFAQAANVVLEVSLTANQTGLVSGWNTVKYNNKVTDVQNAYSTSTGLFTPTVAGLYAVSATVSMLAVAGNFSGRAVCKNGAITTAQSQQSDFIWSVTPGSPGIVSATALIYCNGTTDTISMMAYYGAAGNTFYSGANSVFPGVVNMVATLLQSGPPGATGPQGATGLQGVTGGQGATGLQGATGPQGATGLTSISGVGTPTKQAFTAAGAFTYTSTSGAVRWIRIRAAASGGGGSATSGAANGANGGDLTMSVGGTLAVTLGGGKGAVGIGAGAGGAYTAGTIPANWLVIFALPGGNGSNGATYGAFGMGGVGGVNMFGGQGGGGGQSAGTAGQPGTGAGGGGGGYGGNAVAAQGAGGGAGCCAEIIVANPTPGTAFSFTGNLGNFGAGGFASGQYAGAAGGVGGVYIEEFYA